MVWQGGGRGIRLRRRPVETCFLHAVNCHGSLACFIIIDDDWFVLIARVDEWLQECNNIGFDDQSSHGPFLANHLLEEKAQTTRMSEFNRPIRTRPFVRTNRADIIRLEMDMSSKDNEDHLDSHHLLANKRFSTSLVHSRISFEFVISLQ